MAGAKIQNHDYRFPGESQEYRKARNELLAKEQELRDRIEEVAALRSLRTYLAAVRRFYAYLAAFDLHPTLATDKLAVRLRAILGRFSPPPPSVRSRDLERLMNHVMALPPQAEPERGRVSRSRRVPHPRRGRSQSWRRRPMTSAGRAAA